MTSLENGQITDKH